MGPICPYLGGIYWGMGPNRGSQKGVILDPLFWSFWTRRGVQKVVILDKNGVFGIFWTISPNSLLQTLWRNPSFSCFCDFDPLATVSVVGFLTDFGIFRKNPQKCHFRPPKVPFLVTFLTPFLTHARMYSLVNLSINDPFLTKTGF